MAVGLKNITYAIRLGPLYSHLCWLMTYMSNDSRHSLVFWPFFPVRIYKVGNLGRIFHSAI